MDWCVKAAPLFESQKEPETDPRQFNFSVKILKLIWKLVLKSIH